MMEPDAVGLIVSAEFERQLYSNTDNTYVIKVAVNLPRGEGIPAWLLPDCTLVLRPKLKAKE